MRSEAVIAKLKAHEAEIKALGATSLYLFGSVARDEALGGSDVDIFIDYDEASDFSLIELARLQQKLSDLLGGKVDLTTRTSLHPMIRPEVEASARRII